MPRPERPLDPDAGALARFAADLRQLRRQAGNPSYRVLARRAHYSATALSEAAGGTRLPSLAVALSYVRACDGDARQWEIRWREVAALLEPGSRRTPGPCPYPGRASFQPSDAHWFAGRARLITRLAALLSDHPVIAVRGRSGAGISSLLRAGLLPALESDGAAGSPRWHSLLMTPGERPVEELAVLLAAELNVLASELHAELASDPGAAGRAIRQLLATRAPEARLLLIVDQFEQLVTRCPDPRERTVFVDGLRAAVATPRADVRVVLGVRADPGVHLEIAGAWLTVGPMSREEMTLAITEPAARSGLPVSRALVDTVLDAVFDQPGALALLSETLREVWRHAEGDRLTMAAYRAAGGVDGTIGRMAEDAYQRLAPEHQAIARAIFLRLTAFGDGAPGAAKWIDPVECGDATAHEVLETLVAARLVVRSETGATLAFQPLAHAWPRLRDWLSDTESLRVHRQLNEAARLWQRLGRDPDVLYRGSPLATVLAWAARDGNRMNPLEAAFLRAARTGARRGRNAWRRWILGVAALAPIAIAAASMPRGSGTEHAPIAVIVDGELPVPGSPTPVTDAGGVAVWVNRDTPAESLILGATNAGLEVYNLANHTVQRLPGQFENVDVRGDLVAATDEQNMTTRLYRIDPATRTLAALGDLRTDRPAHGICLYTSVLTGRTFAFVLAKAPDGEIEQWELVRFGDRATASSTGRRWRIGGKAEHCAADDLTGRLYVAEEKRGVWRFGAEPTDSTTRPVAVAQVGQDGLAADVEGLAVAGRYLYVASQGDSTIAVYRTADNSFVRRIRLISGPAADGCDDNSSLAVVATGLGPRFPRGLLICHDKLNTAPGPPDAENYKYIRLEKAFESPTGDQSPTEAG